MPRRFRKHFGNRDKYSVESTTVVTTPVENWSEVAPPVEGAAPTYQAALGIVPDAEIEGMRKVKHLTLSFSNGSTGTESSPLYYALVYVPQGYSAQPLCIPTFGGGLSLYQANQFVMSCGVLDFSGGPCRIRSRLSRNLNSGDSIWLVLGRTTTATGSYFINVQYAITLQ